MFWRIIKFILSFFYDKDDGQWMFDENTPTKMLPGEVLAKALPIAENSGWLVNKRGTIVEPCRNPQLTKLWRNEKLVWRVEFEYTHIAGNDLGAFRRETLGYILINDETGEFIKSRERMRFHKDSVNGSMTELDAIEFAREFARKEGWEWHKPATAQDFGDSWIVRTDECFFDTGIYLRFVEKTGRVLNKSERPRTEKGARMTREEAWEMAKRIAHEKEWVFFEPVCADFENGIWNIHLPPGYDYSVSVKINDAAKKVVEIDFWSGLGRTSLHEKYE